MYYTNKNDNATLEDAQKKAQKDFLSYLNREEQEKTEAQLFGIDFEKKVHAGEIPEFSSLVSSCCYQVGKGVKKEIKGINFYLYGIVDFIGGGKIYDIKTTQNYERGKYFKEYQHEFYLTLFPTANEMIYLIYDRKQDLYFKENYFKGQGENIENVIINFYNYILTNNLLETYKKNWEVKK